MSRAIEIDMINGVVILDDGSTIPTTTKKLKTSHFKYVKQICGA